MWHEVIFYAGRKLAWSVKSPAGVTFTRGTFAEAVDLAADLSAGMRKAGVEHYRCRVFKTRRKGTP